jgi:hypothetical protein
MLTIRKNPAPVTRRYTELVYGYFWMIKDLRKMTTVVLSTTNSYPNQLPSRSFLDWLEIACRRKDIPAHFLRKDRSLDAAAQCIVVAVSFRDFGYKLLDT